MRKKYRVSHYADSTRRLPVTSVCDEVHSDELYIYCYDLVGETYEIVDVILIGRLRMIENVEIAPVRTVSQLRLCS